MNKPNPVQVQKFLGGIDYPVDRDELVEHARAAGADEFVLDSLRALPKRRFDGPNAVSHSLAAAT